VIIRGRGGAGVEVRAGEFGSSAIPWPTGAAVSWSGLNVTADSAQSLPAVAAAIRLVSETIASLPLVVRDGEERAVGTPAWQLLMESPASDMDPFAWMLQVAGSIETWGNAYCQIVRGGRGGRALELLPLDPSRVRVRRDPGDKRKRFDVTGDDGHTTRDLTTAEILHIPGYVPPGHVEGMSPIALHKHSLGNGMALQSFTGRYWANDASPGMVIKVPGNLTQQQAQEVLRVWGQSHQGLHNAHRPAVLAGGADIERIPINLEDAAFIAQANMSVEDVARIWRLPAHMLGIGAPTGATAEQESLRFLTFSLMPRLRRIEQGVAHGLPDLFAVGGAVRPEFDTAAMLRADTPTRTAMITAGRQGGWLSINDARRMEALPPIPEGDAVQQTPVGGAPNLQPGGANAAE